MSYLTVSTSKQTVDTLEIKQNPQWTPLTIFIEYHVGASFLI